MTPDASRYYLRDRFHLFSVRNRHYAFAGRGRGIYRLDEPCWKVLWVLQRSKGIFAPYRQHPLYHVLEQLKASGIVSTRPPSLNSSSDGARAPSPARSLKTMNSIRRCPWNRAGIISLFPRGTKPHQSLIAADIHITHRCNLECRYCYGHGVDKHYLSDPCDMNSEVQKATIKFLADHASAKQPFQMIFFGGEPMLAFDGIKFMVKRARKVFNSYGKKLIFSITTNGTLMTTKRAAYLRRQGFSIMVSMDGPARAQNRLRPLKNGSPSYHLVRNGMRILFESYQRPFPVRTTICAANKDMQALMKHFLALGSNRMVFAAESPVTEHEDGLGLDELLYSYERLLCELPALRSQGEDFWVDPFDSLLHLILLEQRRYYPCGAGRSYVAASPRGAIYPCHRFVGDDRYLLGDVHAGIDYGKSAPFMTPPDGGSSPCRGCWARSLCAGGCPHRHAVLAGSITERDPEECRFIKRIIELTIHYAFELQQMMPDQLARTMESVRDRIISERRSVLDRETDD